MTASPGRCRMFVDGGVACGVGGLWIQAHLTLKCRPRHLRHPAGQPGWCRMRGSVNRRDPRMTIHLVYTKEPSCQQFPLLSFASASMSAVTAIMLPLAYKLVSYSTNSTFPTILKVFGFSLHGSKSKRKNMAVPSR